MTKYQKLRYSVLFVRTMLIPCLVSGLIVMCAGMSSCNGHAPVVDICLSDPANDGFQCQDKKQKPYFLPYKQSEDYIAIPPSDFEALINYCKNHKFE